MITDRCKKYSDNLISNETMKGRDNLMTHSSDKVVGRENIQTMFAMEGSPGVLWLGVPLNKMIVAWVVLCVVFCGCATNEKDREGSVHDARIAKIVEEDGARIEKENLAHAQLVREQEKKIRTQMPIR